MADIIIEFQSTCPARGTTQFPRGLCLFRFISIHVPREGHDYKQTALFLLDIDFNPRAPRGARRAVTLDGLAGQVISIHVPREGHDRALYGVAASS